MAILQLNSKDPNFGYIIKKNPASGMQVRSIRKGTSFGWFSNNGESFNILFKDADNAVSFGDQEFEFLNTSRYNSSLFVLNAIGEYFSSTVRETMDIDTPNISKSLIINMINIKHLRQLTQFNKYFSSFIIDYELEAAKSYKVTITTKETFNSLFNFTNLLMLFITLSSTDEYLQLDQTATEKYMLAIERLDAPFFIRYLFNRAMFRSKNQFNKYKDRLEKTERYNNVKMEYGDTAMQRRSVISKLLSFDNPIIDIGCGEGFYAIPFAQQLKDKPYIAIDIQKNLTDIVNKKASKKEIDNIKTYNHINDYIIDGNIHRVGGPKDIILTEVIEHMVQDESIKLLEIILDNLSFNKFIVTVPNKEFNQYYMLEDDEFRHDDHDWEPTKHEFQIFMEQIINKKDCCGIEFIDIGDTIDGVSTSIGCVITRK